MNNFFQPFEKMGLQVFLAGAEYNFRVAKIGEAAVSQQITKALEKGGFDFQSFYTGEQVHGPKVAFPQEEISNPFAIGHIVPQSDGLLTNQPQQVLMIKFADCTPVIIFDANQKAFAIVHSGWRSTVQKISQLAVKKMQEKFACKLEDLWVYIGPSIDQDHYEVGEEVYQAFAEWDNHAFYIKPGQKEGKYQLSMTDANMKLIQDLGIPQERIMVDRRSTYLSSELHSARKEGSDYQLNGLFAMIK
ncbi:peptidoglycan editing factor PgeF [Facklamia sp. P12955]|uniref:peptidoglycan editing factor PgeF n=1 Tax=Facklamia sp. P12955 TaxID=3421946 RepID=UPI003D180C47